MSKVIPIALAAHYALGSTSTAYALKITRPDSTVFAFTSADDDVVIAGTTYLSGPGLNISQLAIAAGLAVDNLELQTLNDGAHFIQRDVMGGLWRNARVEISEYNVNAPADGVNVLGTYTIGIVNMGRSLVVAELRGLQQPLQQSVGAVVSETCRARLGDTRCKVNLATYTFTGTLTSVTSNQLFAASGLAQAADYFGDGSITFTSGDCVGLSQKIKTHAAGGVITTSLPFFSTVAVGNTFTIVAGCRKRRQDCRDKFANILNMQAEPDAPGIDAITSPP